MVCVAPRPRWRIGFLRPTSAGLCAVAAAIVVVGAVGADDWWGVLPYIGAGLFFIGSSNGTLNAHGLRSLTGLFPGVEARRQTLERECMAQRLVTMLLAERISPSPDTANDAVAMATTTTCRVWVGGSERLFTLLLYCHVVQMARLQRELATGSADLTTDERRHLVLVLRRGGSVPTAEIARILDLELAWVEQVLRPSATGPET